MWTRTLLASALALALTACGGGGGGGNVRPDAPPVSPPATPPPPPPPPPPPTSPPPPQPAFDAHLSLIDALGVAAAGHTGAGVRIGVVDTGVNRNHPALQGRVVANYNYVDPRTNNLAVDDVVGHGTTVAQLAAGTPFGLWPGGVAQAAQLVSARIINDVAPDDDGSGNGNQVNGALGLQGIHDDLVRAGVRIMNNSWGGLYWTDANATAAIAGEYRNFIFGNDGLVVFAAGNESRANPSDVAALPSQAGPNGTSPAADLERGWLVVAALDTAAPTRLAAYSNACGVAMRYCLVAPGTVLFTGTNDAAGSPTYWYGGGTSYATPLVSGAAALVWQAFPYFNNDLVRQTLLGTAKDLGAAGVDPVFGYGLLDVARALRGPARLDWGTTQVTLPAGTNAPWSNDIAGSGALLLSGGGNVVDGVADPSLALTGNSSFSGGLRITGGATIALRGGMQSEVGVDAGSYLDVAEATLSGRLTNQGVVRFNGAPTVARETVFAGPVDNQGVFFNQGYAHTTLAGDYRQGAGGEYWMVLGSDPLRIGGSAQLDGKLYVHDVAQGYVAHRQTEVLIAAGGVNGRFASLGYRPAFLLEATVGYGSDRVWLDVDRIDVAAAAGALGNPTPATLGSATRVEDAFSQLDAAVLQPMTPSVAVIPAEVAQGAAKIQQVAGAAAFQATLDSLSGQLHGLAGQATFDGIDQNRRALSAHFDEVLRAGGARGAWMRETGGVGRSGPGGQYDLRGWMIGQDVAMGARGVLGYAFGETRADSRIADQGDHGRDRQAQAQLYGGWSQGAFYALAQAGAGRYQRELDRGLLLGDQRLGVDSRYAGDFASAGLEGGYRFRFAHGLGVSPYAGLQYAQVALPAFSEAGGLGFGLRSDGGVRTQTQAIAGLRASLAGVRWQWNAYAEWQQPLAQGGDRLQASFTGIDSLAPLPWVDAEAAALAGWALQAWLSPRARLSLGYDQRFGDASWRSWSLRCGVGF